MNLKNILNKINGMSKMKQIANSFDKATLIKIFKGALISGTSAFSLYILDYIGTIQFSDTNIAALVAFLVPFLVNVIKEYKKGEK